MPLKPCTHPIAFFAAGWMLLALSLSGCFLNTGLSHQPAAQSPIADDSPDQGAKSSPKTSAAATASAANHEPAGARALLLRGGWYRVPPGSDESPTAIYAAALPPSAQTVGDAHGFHYRHAGVEQLLARPANARLAAARNELAGLLADKDPLVAATAAIVLAREGYAKVSSHLINAIKNEELPLAARGAAIEALGQLPGNAQIESLGRLADEYGQYVPGAATGYQAELHAELLRALARHVDAADDPRFTAAAEVPAAQVRIETLRAWGASARGIVPTTILDLRSNDDPQVRSAALTALAARKHPDAFEFLTAALHDTDLSVRMAAIRGLGMLDDSRSQAELANQLNDRGELIRAEAVATLAAHGSRAVVLGAGSDTAWRVRLEVAKALAGYCDVEGMAAARRMLNDASAEVERQVVRSLAAWPTEAALPVLLDALARDAVTVRKLAAEQIAARCKGSPRFPYEAPPARRAQALAQLREYVRPIMQPWSSSAIENASQLEASGQDGKLNDGNSTSPRARASDDQVAALLKAGKFAALAALGPAVVGSLERLAIDRHLTLPEKVYQDVLPRYSPAFAALDKMHRSKAALRQQAAEDLVAATKKTPAGRLAVARLCELMTTETDSAIWIRALEALGGDDSEPAIRMARMALGQASGEVRRRGCEYLAAHPDPAHEIFLAPCLADSEQEVVLAAIHALGAASRITDINVLKRLLSSPSETVQLETAVALARFHDPTGDATIERLSYSSDVATRGHVARALGDLGNSRFLAILIRLLDDTKATVSHAALASLARIVGRDVAQSTDGTTVSIVEQIARWKKWYAGAAEQR